MKKDISLELRNFGSCPTFTTNFPHSCGYTRAPPGLHLITCKMDKRWTTSFHVDNKNKKIYTRCYANNVILVKWCLPNKKKVHFYLYRFDQIFL